jgi:hypothetical protein
MLQHRWTFDTSNPIEARRYLRNYGLTPPGVDTFEKQLQRCKRSTSNLGKEKMKD